MFGNAWHKKEKPFLGIAGFGGGAVSLARKGAAGGAQVTGGIQSPTGAGLKVGAHYYHFFQAPGTLVVEGAPLTSVDAFVVGGGGGSGGGGGGAGSVCTFQITLGADGTYPVSVGEGGSGGNDGPTVAQGGHGGPSYIQSVPGAKLVEAGGGGAGGITDGTGPPTWKAAGDGLLGGSGGGQSASTDYGSGPGEAGPTANTFPGTPGAASPPGGFGYDGGSAYAYAATNSMTGSGGGAGGAGGNGGPPGGSPKDGKDGGIGVACPWIDDPVMFTSLQTTVKFATNLPNNAMDSSTVWKVNNSAPLTFNPWPGSAGPYSPTDGYGANGFQCLKTNDGSRVRWAVSTDSSDRYLWASEDGLNWTSPGSTYDTDGSTQYVEAKYIAWAGGSNASVTTVSASVTYGTPGPGSSGRWFGGGGGAGSWGNPGGEGGVGGGGDGGAPTTPGNVNALRGMQNTGGGGGGNGYPTWGGPAPGGDGFVAIRYSA
jgi:hypothetical protein